MSVELLTEHKTNGGFWDREDFEDHVARALIAMFETKISKNAKRAPKEIRCTEKELAKLRSLGAYFPAGDRIASIREIDLANDSLVQRAAFSHCYGNGIGGLNTFFDSFYVEKVRRIEVPPSIRAGVGVVYKLLILHAQTEGELELQKSYVTVDKDGFVHPSSRIIQNNDGFGNRAGFSLILGEAGNTNIHASGAACAINFYNDKRHTWNVRACEQNAKASFSVYEEQIKSLFYARKLPVTATGRKRPILHWVKSHQRRSSSGIDIDIDCYLRGATSFEMNGTKFEITSPTKGDI